MTIAKHIYAALDSYQKQEYEVAMSNASIAVDATAKKHGLPVGQANEQKNS